MSVALVENPSASRNCAPIGAVLQRIVRPGERIVEVGAGNGQHAASLIGRLPAAAWQVTEAHDSSARLSGWLERAGDERLLPPVDYEAGVDTLDCAGFTLALAINVAHILPWDRFVHFVRDAASLPLDHGKLVCYGPFSVHRRHTSEGNAEFDRALRRRGVGSALRDVDELDAAARRHGFRRERWFAMPANNQLLVYRRDARTSSESSPKRFNCRS